MIATYGQAPDVLLYVDPPYLGETRTSRQYLHELSRPEEHLELLDALLSCRSAVVLSGYPSPLYDEALTGWQRIEIATTTRQGNTRGERTEVLWINRDPQPALFHLCAVTA